MLLHSRAQSCVLNVVERHGSVSRPHNRRNVLRSDSRQQSADSSRQHRGLARELRSQACVLMARYKQTETRDIETSRASGDGTSAVVDQQVEAPIDWRMTSLAFLFPALGGLLFGYDIGATSGAILSITSQAHSGTTWYDLSSFQSGLVVSASLFGALGGSAAAFVVGDKLGRKRELLLAALLYGLGTAAESLAPGLEILLAGRILYGLGIGFAMHAAPAYIAETAPASKRGLLISLKECLIVVGILLGYLTSYLFIESNAGWRSMFGLAAFPTLVLGAGMAWLPDSPRWLLFSGAPREEVFQSLSRCRGMYSNEEATEQELAKMNATAQEGPPSEGLGQLFSARNMKPLTVGVSLMLFQQITGQPSVLYYAGKIFEAAGFGDAKDATGISVFLGFFKLLLTGVAVATVDSVGRRPLLLGGVSGMVVALVGLGVASIQLQGEASAWTSVAALLAYVGCYQLSFGPISWLIAGEVFPLSVRGPATALATLTNFGSNFLVSLALPSLQDNLGPGYTYLLFAGVGVVAVAVIYGLVPETKGKTLEEIEASWIDKDS